MCLCMLTNMQFFLKSVTMSMLTVLKLHSCEGITSASMAAVARSSMLEVRIHYIEEPQHL